ncbi:hypothetical protein [Nitrosomonas communis]|uniref:hypothetical protein n=1 Tax=Nitrosomonas communis TaxID=44574 RepID=UPI003D29EC03
MGDVAFGSPKERDAPSKQKRGRRAVPPTCGRAEARSRRPDVEGRIASDQLGSLLD